ARLKTETTCCDGNRRSICTSRRRETVAALIVCEAADSQRGNTHAGADDRRSTSSSHLATDGRPLCLSERWGKPEHARDHKEARDLTCHSHTRLEESQTGMNRSRTTGETESILRWRLCGCTDANAPTCHRPTRHRCMRQNPKIPQPGDRRAMPDIPVT